MKKFFTLIIATFFSIAACGQKLYVGVGTNWFLPLSEGPYATMHPVHIIESPLIESNALKIGSMQVSALYTKTFKPKSEIHYKFSLIKNSHWQAFQARDITAAPIGYFAYAVNNYGINLSAALQYNIKSKLYLGIGAGFNTSLFNSTSLISVDASKKVYINNKGKIDGTALNPFIPLNIRWQFKNWMIGIDYNQYLLKTHPTYAGILNGANYGVIQFEVMKKLFGAESKKNK